MRDFLGEFLGTLIIVFFGCGSVAVTVLFDSHSGLFQVAAIWGIGVTLAIYASRSLSCAHLNPAVSIAFVLARRMAFKKLPSYLMAQLIGAFVAAFALYSIFSTSIIQFEMANNIVRGSPESIQTAMMFGEYFPNPLSGKAASSVSYINAFVAEGAGTFLLVFLIFFLTDGCNVGRPDNSLAPVFIGITITGIISIIAPLTQAGINPARDFGPRLFAYFAGWGRVAIPGPRGGIFSVYILAPILGGIIASLFFTRILQPMMEKKSRDDEALCCK